VNNRLSPHPSWVAGVECTHSPPDLSRWGRASTHDTSHPGFHFGSLIGGQRLKARRRGAAILIVLAILAVFGVALAMAMRANLAARAESRRALQRLQAEYLATAGLDVARERLSTDNAYTGETWQVAAEELGGRDRAEVTIDISPVADRPNERRVSVVATYPIDDERWRQQRYRLEHIWNHAPDTERSEQ